MHANKHSLFYPSLNCYFLDAIRAQPRRRLGASKPTRCYKISSRFSQLVSVDGNMLCPVGPTIDHILNSYFLIVVDKSSSKIALVDIKYCCSGRWRLEEVAH